MAFVTTQLPATTQLFGRLSNAFGDFKAARHDNRLFRKTLSELRQLSDRELNDLGLSRGSLIDVARSAVYNK